MKVIFVYNAESGAANSILDIGHKILKPDTYSCNLCQLTFGTFTENSEWKKLRKSSNHEMEFLHKDEFEKKYNETLNYPTILIRPNFRIIIFVVKYPRGKCNGHKACGFN